VTLSKTGTHTFSAAAFGYGARTALSVTVKNVGSLKQTTGALTIELTGENTGAFTLSTSTLAGINHNATRSFNVRPVQGLPVLRNPDSGVIIPYTATVLVSGDNGIIAVFNVSFKVNRQAGATINSVPLRRQVTSNSITVIPILVTGLNPGGQTVEYAISTSKTSTASALNKLKWQSDTTFTRLDPDDSSTELKPLTTYYVFARSALSNNANAGAVRRSAAIRTDLPAVGITLNRTGTHTFTAATFGYTTRPALQVTINNVGKDAATGLTISVTGVNASSADSFELSAASFDSIPANSNRNFVIRPKAGLAGGLHEAVVKVSGDGLTERSFIVKFTVKRAAGSTVSGAPALSARTHNSITVRPVSVTGLNPGGQTVEYAISTSTSTPAASAWQSGTTFTGLSSRTTYYVFARTMRNDSNNAGAVQRSLPMTTAAAP